MTVFQDSRISESNSPQVWAPSGRMTRVMGTPAAVAASANCWVQSKVMPSMSWPPTGVGKPAGRLSTAPTALGGRGVDRHTLEFGGVHRRVMGDSGLPCGPHMFVALPPPPSTDSTVWVYCLPCEVAGQPL